MSLHTSLLYLAAAIGLSGLGIGVAMPLTR